MKDLAVGRAPDTPRVSPSDPAPAPRRRPGPVPPGARGWRQQRWWRIALVVGMVLALMPGAPAGVRRAGEATKPSAAAPPGDGLAAGQDGDGRVAGQAFETLWGPAAPVGLTVETDLQPVELGTVFTAQTSGDAYGVRFWKTPANVGPHVGSLWSGDGTRLASATFRDETSWGWQTVTFDQPVALRAAQTYVVSYLAPYGGYPVTEQFRESSRSPALAVAVGESGRYAYGAGGLFPDQAFNASQYWVDVNFRPSQNAAPSPSSAPVPVPELRPGAPERRASGGAFPDQETTGVPVGTQLTPSGSLTVTQAGAVIDGLQVNGSITVRANNVTIKNTKIVGGGIDNGDGLVTGTLIQDVEIDGGGADGFLVGVNFSGFTVVRANIHHVGVGIQATNDVVVQDSYVHDIVVEGDPATTGSHNEAFLSNGGSNIVVKDNRLDSGTQPNVSSALSLYGDFAQIADVLVQGNLFNGGGYCVYAGSADGKDYPRAAATRFIGNTFGRELARSCGAYGAVSSYEPGDGNEWRGNTWIDGGVVRPQ